MRADHPDKTEALERVTQKTFVFDRCRRFIDHSRLGFARSHLTPGETTAAPGRSLETLEEAR